MRGRRKHGLESSLFKFAPNAEQWKIENVSSRIKGNELILTVNAKIYNEKVSKVLNNAFNISLKLDEANIHSVD
jgi:hypothetical protein